MDTITTDIKKQIIVSPSYRVELSEESKTAGEKWDITNTKTTFNKKL